MAEYDRIYPGAAKTILEMAHAEQSNRQLLESQDLRHRMWMEKAGLLTGFIICMTGITLSGALVFFGKSLEGFSVFFTSLAALVAAIIYKSKAGK